MEKDALRLIQHTYIEMRNNGELCDFTFQSQEGCEIFVHGLVMAGCSTYLKSLIENGQTKIILNDVPLDILGLIVEYAYTMESGVTVNNVEKLLEISETLGIVGIRNACYTFMADNVNITNCIKVLRLCKICNYQTETDKAFRYVLLNFSKLSMHSNEFQLLNVNELDELLSCDRLNVNSEETALRSVLKWVNYDSGTREKYLIRLLSRIRWAFADARFCKDLLSNEQILRNTECFRFLYKIFVDLDWIKANSLVGTELNAPMALHQHSLYAIGGYCASGPVDVVETYDAAKDCWLTLTDTALSRPRAYHKCAGVGSNIFVIGGYDGSSILDSCHRFNTIDRTWKEMTPMPTARCRIAVAVDRDIIYVVGGQSGAQTLSIVEIYDVELNQWSRVRSMNERRSDCGGACLNKQVYVVGGVNDVQYLRTAECYDPKTNQWTFINPLETARSGSACVAHGGLLFTLGGIDGISRLSSCIKYDPNDPFWMPLINMSTEICHMGAEVMNDMIYVVGGCLGEEPASDVYRYDIRSDKWHQISSLSSARAFVGTCVVSGYNCYPPTF